MTPHRLRVAAAAALAVLVRVPFFRWPLISDEGSYAYNVYWWVRGHSLYVNLLGVERPQGLFLAYWVPVQLWGGATWVIRLWGALWIAATTLVVFACARLLVSERAATLAAVVYALYSAMPSIEGFTANAETFMVLPLTLSALALLKRNWLLAGVAAGCAVAFKASAGSAFLLAGAWWLYSRAGKRDAARFVAGAVIVLAAMVVHGTWSAGWRTYLYNMVLIRVQGVYQKHGSALVAAVLGWVATCAAWLPLLLVLPSGRSVQRRSAAFLMLWIGSSLVGMSLSGDWNWHYWIQLMPSLCIAASAGLVSLWEEPRGVPRILVALTLAVPIMVVGYVIPLSPAEASESLYHRPGYVIAEDVSAYVRAHTTEDEMIYVAFAEADIYHLSRRRAAVPYLFYAYVVSLPGAYDDIVDSVARRVPTYVLALDRPITSIDPDGRFWQTLEDNYVPEKTFETAVLYRRRPN